MLFDAFSGSDIGIDILYCTDGSIFNLRRLQAKTMVLFTNPSARAEYDTKSIFKRSLTGLNQSFPSPRLVASPRQRPSKDHGEDWSCQRVSVRWRLCTERDYQSQHIKQCRQVLNGLWQFWPNHQHKKDISDATATAWKTIRRAKHHHQGATTEEGRKVHQLRQHHL